MREAQKHHKSGELHPRISKRGSVHLSVYPSVIYPVIHYPVERVRKHASISWSKCFPSRRQTLTLLRTPFIARIQNFGKTLILVQPKLKMRGAHIALCLLSLLGLAAAQFGSLVQTFTEYGPNVERPGFCPRDPEESLCDTNFCTQVNN